jgi:3-oxoacyl-[acyl-carrier protein] reductase
MTEISPQRAKPVVITGAAKGIGRAVALRLAADDHFVIGVDVDGDALAETMEHLVRHGRGMAVECDLASQASVADLLSACAALPSPVTRLVSNAGIGLAGDALEITEADVERVMQVNVMGAFRLIHGLLPAMIERGDGRIVTVASVAGQIGLYRRAAYAASKAALIALTRSVAVDFGRHGVRSNSICPGAIDTEMVTRHYEALPPDRRKAVEAALLKRQITPRLGQPEEVASAAAYLLSDEASFVNGAEWNVDGGWAALNDIRVEEIPRFECP